jgi:starch synthase
VARILMVASEAAPWAKTGGLADVVGSLPGALGKHGHEAATILPRYGTIPLKGLRRVFDTLPVWLGPDRYETSIWLAAESPAVYLVDCPPLFDRPGLYGEAGLDYPDNHLRFAVLSKAALALARSLFRPDIFHCHDWQAGLLPAYLRTTYALDPTYVGMRTLFTIHNLGYQGLFPRSVLPEVGLDDSVFRPDGMEFFGQASYIKAGISFSDALSTVSPTYAREIQGPELGFGLDGALRARAASLTGILNGVDYTDWDPESDPFLPAHYSVSDLSGKRACKQALLDAFGLPPEAMDAPLAGIVSRFTRQKGADLIAEAAGQIADEGMYMVALGTGEPEYEELFLRLAADHPGRIAVRIGFDNALAHLIEAGSDIFLMPSRYEPCGLNQIYSLRYGTVPVVRATGGLDDTIDVGTGFKFAEYAGWAFAGALRAAAAAFSNRELWTGMMLRGMSCDYSWETSAMAYSELYQGLLVR